MGGGVGEGGDVKGKEATEEVVVIEESGESEGSELEVGFERGAAEFWGEEQRWHQDKGWRY